MKRYVGTEELNATPMTRGDYNVYRGWTIPENEDPSDKGYLTERTNGHVNWIPKDVFENTYRELGVDLNEGTTFEEMKELEAKFGFDLALIALQEGYKVARSGWNGKGMWIEYCEGKDHELAIIEPFFVIKNVKNSYNTWVPSVSDLLAQDWSLA